MDAYVANEYSRRHEEVNSKGKESRWSEESANSCNLEKIKRSLLALLQMVDHAIEADSERGRKQNSNQKKVEEAEQRRAFLEEEMLIPMLHRRCDRSRLPIGDSETSFTIFQLFPEVGPSRKCAKEASLPLGPRLDENPLVDSCSSFSVLGQPNHTREGLDSHIGTENLLDMDGAAKGVQTQFGILENSVSLDNGSVDKVSFKPTHGSSPILAENVPKTSLLNLDSNLQSGAIEIVLPFEEELVEAQNVWNIGKALGISVSNELAAIEAISKVKECQDFFLPRRRGRGKKNKGLP